MCFGLFFAFLWSRQLTQFGSVGEGEEGEEGGLMEDLVAMRLQFLDRCACLTPTCLSPYLFLSLTPSLSLSLLLPTATGFTLPHALATQGWGDVALVVAAAAAALIGLCAFSFTHFRMRLANWWRAMPVAGKPDRQLKSDRWKALPKPVKLDCAWQERGRDKKEGGIKHYLTSNWNCCALSLSFLSN